MSQNLYTQVASRFPQLLTVHRVTDVELEVFHYRNGDTFHGMATSQLSDKAEIQTRLELLLDSSENFNAIIAAIVDAEGSAG